MNLFTEPAVPVTLKAWSGATERAPEHDETKVVKATFEIELTPELASALNPGDGEVKFVAFKALDDNKVRPFLRTAQFEIGLKPQRLTIQSTPDSPVAICFDAVKIGRRLTVKSDGDVPVLRVSATVGPCGPSEYAFLGAWQNGQRFVTFEEAEPALPLEATDADEKARVVTNDGPIPQAPIWNDADAEAAAAELRADADIEQGHRYPKGKKKHAPQTVN